MPTFKTDPLPKQSLQAAVGEGGRKLEIKLLCENGHRIALLDEKRFWRHATRKASA